MSHFKYLAGDLSKEFSKYQTLIDVVKVFNSTVILRREHMNELNLNLKSYNILAEPKEFCTSFYSAFILGL